MSTVQVKRSKWIIQIAEFATYEDANTFLETKPKVRSIKVLPAGGYAITYYTTLEESP